MTAATVKKIAAQLNESQKKHRNELERVKEERDYYRVRWQKAQKELDRAKVIIARFQQKYEKNTQKIATKKKKSQKIEKTKKRGGGQEMPLQYKKWMTKCKRNPALVGLNDVSSKYDGRKITYKSLNNVDTGDLAKNTAVYAYPHFIHNFPDAKASISVQKFRICWKRL